VDEKEEDKSEESFRKHLVFYKKLNKKISDIHEEIQVTGDANILRHLNERIEAIEQDQTRIRKMFPATDDETWKNLN